MVSCATRIATAVCLTAACAASFAADAPRNVVIFVADGLRALSVRREVAPTMSLLRDGGVWFKNSHAMFPTFTMPNAASLATGHYIGDHGNFGNTLYAGFALSTAAGSVTPFVENDAVLGEMNQHFSGDYLDENSLFAAARAAGIQTAAIGKLGPVLMQDLTERSGERTIIVDDSTGRAGGIPLAASLAAALQSAGVPQQAPTRGDNGKAGDSLTPGTQAANTAQQAWFTDVTVKAVLPQFKAAGKPFLLMFWSRDPDGTQHNQGDSLGKLDPGINGPTSLAAIRNADDNLTAIRGALAELGLADSTDILVTADHGFATISKQSRTSAAARMSYPDVPHGLLPPGFVAIDIAAALGLKLFDPDAEGIAIDAHAGKHPSRANGLIGREPGSPDVIVAANGNSDLVYLPSRDPKALARRVIDALLAQDYTGGLFVDDALGRFPGTLPLSAVGLLGSAITPKPAMVISFSSAAKCAEPAMCTANVADTGLQQGQGMHGSFSRADTHNFMAAAGPDFKLGFIDPAPVSNADVAMTAAHLLGLQVGGHGKLAGRVMAEALAGGAAVRYSAGAVRSAADSRGLRTEVRYQQVGAVRYYDAAGIPGRTVGLAPRR